ncbi:hypothetical protein HVTV-2_gp106 [Haloarcula virus HVTV-2]|uniref:Uncharacterized protein n=1 Tax=Haloarcula vallismortis tailed virus 1 TaxID=1262528 RepID=L7TKG6_9CAUD|nr:hypothetical protein HVTV1_106 [Haloarcula vallismortis tailed virus 1]AGC34475.1 hypothetical protein HVTV1_106 [Haloarcula vallismortis tailed virus 1]UBF22913.1 hypothetical protein HVTV-2_gp106 [Haloarcula virus HVTV-2]
MFESALAEVQMMVMLSLVIFLGGLWLTMLVYVALRHFERKSRRRTGYGRY